MPLILKKNLAPEGVWGLWNITEPESYFVERLNLSIVEKANLEQIKGHRRLEWLAARYLLHLLSERHMRGEVLKDEFGKPFLSGADWDISLSHSNNMAGVAAFPKPVGIDVQKIVAKIERIAHKYLSDYEAANIRYRNRLEYLHLYWGAKEAMYKAYGRKEIDFKRHMNIEPFTFNPRGGTMSGSLKKAGVFMKFEIQYELLGAFVIVIAKSL